MRSQSVIESLNPRGYLEIIKRYLDGTEEVVFSDHNMITIGMGNNLAALFGSEDALRPVSNHIIRYFQLGSGNGSSAASSITSLISVFGGADYGNTALNKVSHSRVTAGGAAAATETFIEIDQAMINKPAEDQIQFVIDLDTDTANGESITEIGLFATDPYNLEVTTATIGSILCAYRYFSSITKSASFALTFKWTIEF